MPSGACAGTYRDKKKESVMVIRWVLVLQNEQRAKSSVRIDLTCALRDLPDTAPPLLDQGLL